MTSVALYPDARYAIGAKRVDTAITRNRGDRMLLPITSLYGTLATLLLVGLALRTALMRRRLWVGLGDGDHPELARAIRVHSNAAEHIPIGILLLGLLELQGAYGVGLHVAALVFLVGRGLHALGLSRSPGPTKQRVWGILLTWLALVGMAASLLLKSLIAWV